MLRFLVGTAAFVIVVAGLRTASAIVVPLLFALFLATLLTAPLRWMRKTGLGTLPALLVVGGLVIVMVGGLLALTGDSLSQFASDFPSYREDLRERVMELFRKARSHGIPVPKGTGQDLFNANEVVDWAGTLMSGLGGVLTNSMLVIFTAIFMLLEASGFATKLQNLPGEHGQDVLKRTESVVQSVQQYIVIKAFISLISGAALVVGLWLLGVPNALLWGVVAFATNFIPNIGAFLTAIPLVLVTLMQAGLGKAAAVLGLILAIEFVTGYILSPRLTGKSLGLSTLVVFLSLVFWGWVLGPVGMFLSVPLTMTLKIAMESSDETRWIGVLLSEAPDESRETSQSPQVQAAGNS